MGKINILEKDKLIGSIIVDFNITFTNSTTGKVNTSCMLDMGDDVVMTKEIYDELRRVCNE